jgi:hypothetical protein
LWWVCGGIYIRIGIDIRLSFPLSFCILFLLLRNVRIVVVVLVVVLVVGFGAVGLLLLPSTVKWLPLALRSGFIGLRGGVIAVIILLMRRIRDVSVIMFAFAPTRRV